MSANTLELSGQVEEAEPAPRRRNRRRFGSKNATRMLSKDLGITEDSLKEWLYLCREVDREDEMYTYIRTYIRNGQRHHYGMKVVTIIRIVRQNDREFHHDLEMQDRFRMMLFHGTKLNSIAPILQHGFQSPTANNQMFGTGIYFADRASKSANYCDNTRSGNTAYLFLCDVMIGKCYNAKNAKNSYTTAPVIPNSKGQTVTYDSVRCTGANVPDREEQVEVRGSVIPLGRTVKNKNFEQYTVNYNEYIVYRPEQVKPMYLVKVVFQNKPYFY